MKLNALVQYIKGIKAAHLAVAFMLFWLPILVFAKIANEIIEKDAIHYDRPILYWIHSYTSSFLDSVFYFFTSIGNIESTLAITGLVVTWLMYKKRYSKAALVVVCVGGAGVADFILKLIFHRTRPSLWHSMITETSYSFPSGHAMLSSALALSLIFLLWNTRWRYVTVILAAVLVAGIGVSRLYFGVHYPSDILAGWCASIAWFAIVLFISKDSFLKSKF